MDDYFQQELQTFLKRIKINKNAYIFLDEIENVIKNYPDYTTIIKHPIDLNKIIEKADRGEYTSLDIFNDDIQLMIDNCLTYNQPNTWANREGLAFKEYYKNNYEKLATKIQKHIERKNMIGKKRMSTGTSYSKQKSVNIKGINDSKNGKEDYHNIHSNYSVLPFEDDKIAKNIRNIFMSIRPHLKTSDESIENIVHTLVQGFIKGNKSSDDLYDIGTKFISKHLNKNEEKTEKTKFMKDFKSLIRDIKNKQNEESTKLDQKTLIKIDLNENEENREQRAKLEKIRKIVKKYVEEHKVPGVYLDKEEYSIEPELKKKIYNYVINIRNKFTTSNNINTKIENDNNKKEKEKVKKKDIVYDENDLTNLD
jgi:hypothetical protein